MEQIKTRIRGMSRRGGLLTAAAVLLTAGSIVEWLEGKVLEDYYASSSLLFCALAAAGCALLLTARGRAGNEGLGGALLIATGAVAVNGSLLLLAALAWALSAWGGTWNRTFEQLPARLRVPVLNLASAVLALAELLLRVSSIRVPGRLLVLVLVAAGSVLLNLNVEAQTYVPQTPEERTLNRGTRYRSVPRAGAMGLLGGVFVLLAGAQQIFETFRLLEDGVSVTELLWPVLLAAAGVLLLMRAKREKWLLPACALLLICQLHTLMNLRRILMRIDMSGAMMERTQMAALLFFSELLLLISAVGATWNKPLGRGRGVPVLNLAAAALAAVNGLWSVAYQLSSITKMLSEGVHLSLSSVQTLLLGMLLQLGLVLLNLAMEGREAQPRGWKVDGGKYRRGLSGLVGGFYHDVGGKLQLLAKIGGFLCLLLGLLGVVLAALSLLLLLLQLVGLIPPYFSPMTLLVGGVGSILTALILAVGTWPLYAFGQMTADLHAMRREGVPTAAGEGSSAPETGTVPENPDQLPEL